MPPGSTRAPSVPNRTRIVPAPAAGSALAAVPRRSGAVPPIRRSPRPREPTAPGPDAVSRMSPALGALVEGPPAPATAAGPPASDPGSPPSAGIERGSADPPRPRGGAPPSGPGSPKRGRFPSPSPNAVPEIDSAAFGAVTRLTGAPARASPETAPRPSLGERSRPKRIHPTSPPMRAARRAPCPPERGPLTRGASSQDPSKRGIKGPRFGAEPP